MIENSGFKKEIANRIQEKLRESFSFDLFYEATIFELIPFDKAMLNKAVGMLLTTSKNISIKNPFSYVNDKRFNNLNSLLNLCYKFDVDTTTEQFKPFKVLSPYYRWLIDMDNFNYDDFDAEWIGKYVTRYYYRKIYNNKHVKSELDKIIKNNYDSSLERDYLNIYIRKNWDVED